MIKLSSRWWESFKIIEISTGPGYFGRRNFVGNEDRHRFGNRSQYELDCKMLRNDSKFFIETGLHETVKGFGCRLFLNRMLSQV